MGVISQWVGKVSNLWSKKPLRGKKESSVKKWPPAAPQPKASAKEFLARWIEGSEGPWTIGLVTFSKQEANFFITHKEDHGREGLENHSHVRNARQLIKENDQGEYRPIKGGVDLRRGWKLGPLTQGELLFALDIIYPTAVANLAALNKDVLRVTDFEETANRQTGMYRIVGTLPHEECDEVISKSCAVKCSKIRLWRGEEASGSISTEMPLVCPEACNLFVAACRTHIKGGDDHDH